MPGSELLFRHFCLIVAGAFLCPAQPGVAQTSGTGLTPPIKGDFFILGAGFGPEYIGAEDTIWAVAPAGQFTFDRGQFLLQANYLTLDLITKDSWSLGPAGLLRFGRSDVENAQVDALPDIDLTVELGLHGGYTWNPEDLRRRGGVGGSILFDVGGVHDGYLVSANIRQWLPVGRFSALGIAVGATYGSDDYTDTFFGIDADGAADSGLPIFPARGGGRDVRVAAVYVQPVSDRWAVGAGFLYARLLGDAADSPVALARDQVYFGIGGARAW